MISSLDVTYRYGYVVLLNVRRMTPMSITKFLDKDTKGFGREPKWFISNNSVEYMS